MKIVFKRLLSVLGYLPYQCVLFAARTSVKFAEEPAQIWARNSFALKTLEPGFSDLDLTLVFANEVSFSKISSFLKKADLFRSFCPILGEINTYRKIPGQDFFKHHNFFELIRDPVLLENAKIERNAQTIEAAVFLLRQLEKDIAQIKLFPERRIKKWASHFLTIDQHLPHLKLSQEQLQPSTLQTSIQKAILKILGTTNEIVYSEVNEKLELYLELVRCGVEIGKTRGLMVNNSWWFLFSLTKTAAMQIPPIQLSPIQLQFFLKQITWEVCGCISQITLENRAQTIEHFENLINLLNRQSAVQISPEFEGIRAFISDSKRSLS